MKFSNNSFELSPDDASLIGMWPYQTVAWGELRDLRDSTWVAYETALAGLWRCVDASLESGTTLNEILRDNDINSFDGWALGKLAVFLERVTDINK